ncbi:MAG: hypothetical protein ACPF9H_10735, partial [Aequoribacter sp.]|uniref:hypothetical protein n=1 Tax=Aequoribacter sp. TaxID=2847771 RepID=UPI003C51840A
ISRNITYTLTPVKQKIFNFSIKYFYRKRRLVWLPASVFAVKYSSSMMWHKPLLAYKGCRCRAKFWILSGEIYKRMFLKDFVGY